MVGSALIVQFGVVLDCKSPELGIFGRIFEKFLFFSFFYVYTTGSWCVYLRFGKDSKDGESL